MVAAEVHWQWGNFGEVVGGIGTTAAFVVTFVLLRLELREARAERDRRAAEDVAREADQAGSIAAWLDRPDGQGHYISWRVLVGNASRSPVFNVLVDVAQVRGDIREVATFQSVPPGIDVAAWLDWDRWRHIENPSQLNVRVRFTDAAGRHWRRNWQGALERLEEGVRFD